MAKQKITDNTADKKTEVISETAETVKKTEEQLDEKIIYAFPTQSRCPRCRTTETVAYATKGNVQYRRCLRGICRQTYSVIGTKV